MLSMGTAMQHAYNRYNIFSLLLFCVVNMYSLANFCIDNGNYIRAPETWRNNFTPR